MLVQYKLERTSKPMIPIVIPAMMNLADHQTCSFCSQPLCVPLAWRQAHRLHKQRIRRTVRAAPMSPKANGTWTAQRLMSSAVMETEPCFCLMSPMNLHTKSKKTKSFLIFVIDSGIILTVPLEEAHYTGNQ